MNDNCIYRIEIQGQVDKDDLNAMSPQQMTSVNDLCVLRQGPSSIVFTVSTDQSGLIGLIRYLHGRGIVLLSMTRNG